MKIQVKDLKIGQVFQANEGTIYMVTPGTDHKHSDHKQAVILCMALTSDEYYKKNRHWKKPTEGQHLTFLDKIKGEDEVDLLDVDFFLDDKCIHRTYSNGSDT